MYEAFKAKGRVVRVRPSQVMIPRKKVGNSIASRGEAARRLSGLRATKDKVGAKQFRNMLKVQKHEARAYGVKKGYLK